MNLRLIYILKDTQFLTLKLNIIRKDKIINWKKYYDNYFIMLTGTPFKLQNYFELYLIPKNV